MAELNITIHLDNAAFDGEDVGPEIARILRRVATELEVAGRLEISEYTKNLRDSNGNKVGTAEVDGLEVEAEADDDDEELYHDVAQVLRYTTDIAIRSFMEGRGYQTYDCETRHTWLLTIVDDIKNGEINLDDVRNIG